MTPVPKSSSLQSWLSRDSRPWDRETVFWIHIQLDLLSSAEIPRPTFLIMKTSAYRTARAALGSIPKRSYSQHAAPRHLMSISDLTPSEFSKLVRNAAAHKQAVKAGQAPSALNARLAGQTVAMMFNKRSTRTRVSTEAAVTLLGGHAMFLGKDDIQLGVGFSSKSAGRS